MKELKNTERALLKSYLLNNFRNEYISGYITEKEIEIIKDTSSYQSYLCKEYLKILFSQVLSVFRL